jgi:DHA1 family tetracycline resistance protein-like MFS transporter
VSPTSPDIRSDPRARRVVVFAFVTVFLDMIGFGIIAPLLPLYVSTMGGDAQTVGALFGCFSLTQLLATPWLGRLSDRFGRRPVILLSLAGNALSMFVFALATTREMLPLLFASRILAGATAGNLSACQATIADVTPESDRARAMGTIGAGIGLGMVLGPMVGSALSHFGSWAPPVVAGALATLDLIGAALLMPETNPPEARAAHVAGAGKRRVGSAMRDAIGRRGIPRVLAVYFLIFLGMTNMQVALPLLVAARFDWHETEVGHVFGLLGVASLSVQAFLIGRLSRRFGDAAMIALGGASMAGGLGAIALGSSPWVLLVGVVLVGVSMGVAMPALGAAAARLAAPESRGSVLGIAQSSGGLARTIGPVWSGFLFARLAPTAPFVAGVAAAALALVLALGLRRHEAR